MLQFLPYALAAYGGYKGYKASKDAGGSGLQRLLAGATGAFLGYQGGKMVPGVSTAGFGQAGGIPSFTQLGPIQSLANTSVGPLVKFILKSPFAVLLIISIAPSTALDSTSYCLLPTSSVVVFLTGINSDVENFKTS